MLTAGTVLMARTKTKHQHEKQNQGLLHLFLNPKVITSQMRREKWTTGALHLTILLAPPKRPDNPAPPKGPSINQSQAGLESWPRTALTVSLTNCATKAAQFIVSFLHALDRLATITPPAISLSAIF